MGYNSEVALRVEFTSIGDRDRVIALLPEEQQAMVREMVVIPEDRPVIYAHHPWIKWYASSVMDGYGQIDAVEALLDLCRYAADGSYDMGMIPNAGFFARIGEDADDNEERYWQPSYEYQQQHPDYDLPEPYDMGSIQRSIVLGDSLD